MDNNEIAVRLPKELIAEWKFLVETRQTVEGQEIDPVSVLRQAIATETYLWQQKASANRQFAKQIEVVRRKRGRIVGNRYS